MFIAKPTYWKVNYTCAPERKVLCCITSSFWRIH